MVLLIVVAIWTAVGIMVWAAWKYDRRNTSMTLDEEFAEMCKQYEFVPCEEQFGAAAGEPIRCTLYENHPEEIRHFNHEAKVSWW